MFLVTEWFGTFLLQDDGSVKDQRLFPKDAKALGAVLRRLQDGELLEAETELAAAASDAALLVREERQRRLPHASMADAGAAPTLADRASTFGFTRDHLHAATVELGRLGVRAASARRDMHVVQAVDAIDELTEQANIQVERLREWYGLHFPELVDAKGRNEELAALVAAHTTRDAISAAAPQYAVADSMGGPLPTLEHDAVRHFARLSSSVYATKAELEKYLDNAMMEIAPNVATLLSPVLAARMIRQAGGLRRLATMPAGTIQTLGAEKALFRHIKEGKRPPKHGFLMQHPLVHRAPRYHRGALARSLAAKVALAARADMFTHSQDTGARLAAEFQARADNLKDQQQRQKRQRAKFKGGGKPGFTGKRSFGGDPRGGGGGGPRGGGGGFGGRPKGGFRPKGGGR